MSTLRYWDALKQPPISALKKITGGRLSGMTDIKPQWRYETMTNLFGPCGEGWKITIDKLWTEPGSSEQIMAMALVSVYYRTAEGLWSEPIPGIGGSMLVTKEAGGLHTSDEGYKMAVTDALGVAMKMLGVGADVYMGYWDGSKYKDQLVQQEAKAPSLPPQQHEETKAPTSNVISEPQRKRLWAICREAKVPEEDVKGYLAQEYGIGSTSNIQRDWYEAICEWAQDQTKKAEG